MTITNIRHTGIVVSHMERSLRFYRDLLGMEVWADFCDNSDYVQAVTDVPGANVRMVKLKAGDGVSIELLQYLSHPSDEPQPKKACDVGCSHVALQVDDLETLYEKLRAEGIHFNAPPALPPPPSPPVAANPQRDNATGLAKKGVYIIVKTVYHI